MSKKERKMPDERPTDLAQRLRKAEEAANYMDKIESLASQAPAVREQVSVLQRLAERERHREEAWERAKVSLAAATQAQRNLPDLIANAANLVNQMARTLREVDTFRREATACLGVVDRMDYEEELDQALEEDENAPIQRDAQSIRMLVAARHGNVRIRQLMEQLSPGFEVFAGCDLDGVSMRRELSNLIMAQLATEAETSRPQQLRPAAPPPIPKTPRPEPTAVSESNG